jgi:cysteine-rich repeat protein
MKGVMLATMCVLLVGASTADSVCGDGIKQKPEQCDDGNQYSSDGCSVDCLLENEAEWLCNNTDFRKTVCCPLLVNPVSGEKMCDCAPQTICCPLLLNPVSGELVCDCAEVKQPNPRDGFTITRACLERDIDECNANNGDCHADAICTNFNVVTNPNSTTHMCECRPGLTGDGIFDCVASV